MREQTEAKKKKTTQDDAIVFRSHQSVSQFRE